MNEFHHQQYKWKQLTRTICHETWPVHDNRSKPTYVCLRCTRDKHEPKKFSDSNNMNPQRQPACRQGLTQIEEMLIAWVSPIMYVYS